MASEKSQLEQVLEALHTELADELLRKIRNGEAKANDLNVARQFLKDNEISSVPVEGTPTGDLAKELPEFDDEPVGRIG